MPPSTANRRVVVQRSGTGVRRPKVSLQAAQVVIALLALTGVHVVAYGFERTNFGQIHFHEAHADDDRSVCSLRLRHRYVPGRR